MTSPVQTQPKHTTMYIVFAVAVGLLMIIGLIAHSSAKSDAEAAQKADQLITALNQAGLRAPSKEQIVNVLGNDGGPMCSNPNNALKRGTVLGALTNGAGGPGMRPVIADNNVLKGQLIAISVYCPEYLQSFTEFVNNLKLDDVVKE